MVRALFLFHLLTWYSMEPLPPSARTPRSRWGLWGIFAAGLAALLAACRTAPTGSPPAAETGPASEYPSRPAGTARPAPSTARVPLEYRKDAARHVYTHNAARIYQGKLPPMLHAIGVLAVDIDKRGRVTRLNWLRAPRHAPEVVAEIERTVRAAAPYPAPAQMGRVTWTDTWLWDHSGRFQLDTLTEGQL